VPRSGTLSIPALHELRVAVAGHPILRKRKIGLIGFIVMAQDIEAGRGAPRAGA
jgi:hypothetical protein